jgi:AraC-like DNA-binding protein
MDEDTFVAANDPLSTALMKIKLRAFLNVALDAGGTWGIDFPALDGFTLNVVRKGECWLATKGHSEKIKLRAGDCFLLTGGKEFTLTNDLSLKKRLRAQQLFALEKDGTAVCQGGGEFFVIGTIFRFEGHLPSILFGRLPPVIHIDGDSDQAAVLRWNLERFGVELRSGGMGRSLMLGHLAPIMLLQMLRIYLSTAKNEDNWLVALSHPRLSKALEAMQSDYQRSWSLEQLANLANMSRSGFALMFKKKVGVAPMDYLKHWRMQVACELLKTSDESLSAIASAVGYGSESAFSVAFQRIVKCRPGAYRMPSRP